MQHVDKWCFTVIELTHAFVIVDDEHIIVDAPNIDGGAIHEHNFTLVRIGSIRLIIHGYSENTLVISARNYENDGEEAFLCVAESKMECNSQAAR